MGLPTEGPWVPIEVPWPGQPGAIPATAPLWPQPATEPAPAGTPVEVPR